jgi:hypothetical protein
MKHFNMTQRFYAFICSLHLFFICNIAFGQSPIVVTPVITPPYSSNLDDYANDMIISLTNTSGVSYQIKLNGNLSGDNGISAFTNPNFQPEEAIEIGPFETVNIFPTTGNQNFFDFDNLEYNASLEQQQQLLAQKIIPAGTYTYCVKALDYNTNAPLSDEAPSGCIPLVISMSSPPMPIFPTCGNDINEVEFPVFTWIQPDGIKPGAQLVYDFYMVQIGADDDPYFLIQQAIVNGAGNPFVVTDLPIPTYDYKSYDPPLEEGTKYVWAVQVRDLNNISLFENEGYSIPCTFGWKIPVDEEDEEDNPDENLCQNDCMFTGLNLDDLMEDPYAALDNNPIFNMGDFEIRVFDLNPVDPNFPKRISGMGHMNAPLIGFNYTVRLRIRFEDVELNIDRQAVKGSAWCVEMPTAPSLIPGYNDTGWDGIGLGGADLWALDDYIADKWEQTKDAANTLQETYGFEVPIGVQTGGVSVAITRLRFEPTFATMDVVALVNLNQFNPSLPPVGLGISNLCIGSNGPCKEFKLFVPQDIPIDVMNDQNNISELTLKQSGPKYVDTHGTWLTVNSDGLKNIHVEATFDFPTEMLSNLSNPMTPARAELVIHADSLSDWIFRTSMTPFTVADIPEFEFYPDTAYWDFSEMSNPPVMMEDSLEYAKFALGTEWKGFFAKKMMVKFDSPINKGQDKTEIIIHDLFIDTMGVSVRINANNIVNINEGGIGAFNFSLDTIEVIITNNSFQKGSIKGLVLLSIAERDYNNGLISINTNTQQNFIPYSALFTYQSEDTDGDFIPDGPKKFKYDFLMKPNGGLVVPLWYANLNLTDNSAISVSNNLGDEKFHASALLHGTIGIGGKLPLMDTISLIGIQFNGLGVLSDAPYITGGGLAFALASPQHSIANFPINLKDIKLVKDKDNFPGLQFHLDLNLADTSMNLPKASTKFSIYGRIFDQSMKVSPGFEYATLDEICIDGKLSVLEVKGCIAIYNSDPTYGNGFKGDVSVKFPSMGIGIASIIQFGKVNNMNYWYADAMISLPPGSGIPLFAGLEAYGFGGGAYYNMSRTPLFPNFKLGDVPPNNSGSTGFTPSGITYVPDPTAGLGIKAKLYFGTVKRSVFNSNVNLEVLFDNNGGLKNIWLDGQGRFVSDDDDETKAAVTGVLNAGFDNVNKIFFANLSAKLEAAIITATADLNVYFEDNAEKGIKWHVRFGRPVPDKWVNISFMDLVQVQSYFQAGNFEIDPMPELPPMFQKYITPSAMQDASDRGSSNDVLSTKIIHGGRMVTEFGGDFLMFYGSLKAGIGYDLYIEKLVTGCGGQGNPSNIGINGWYAHGKAYAGIEGEIGLKLNMFGLSGRYQIAGIGAAAMLEAGFANPSWVRGKVVGNYALFDGLLAGKFHYEFAAGQPCIPDSPDPLANINIISDISPKTNLTAAEVTTVSAIATNLKMDPSKHLHFVQKENGQDKHRLFRFGENMVKIDFYKEGVLQPASLFDRKISSDGFGISCIPSSTLNILTNYEFKYTANIQECQNVQYNATTKQASCVGSWSNANYKEEKSVSFKTNNGLDSIPEDLIEYTFPYNLERHFLYQEYSNPKIVMSQGFNPNSYKLGPNGAAISYKVRFIPLNNSNAVSTVNAQVTPGSKTINFVYPADFKTSTYYAVQLVSQWNTPGGSGANSAPTAFTKSNLVMQHSYKNDVTAAVRSRQVEVSKLAMPTNNKRLYEFRFRTSKFSNLAAKLASMNAHEAKFNVKKTMNSYAESYDVIVDKANLTNPQNIVAKIKTTLGMSGAAKPVLRYLPHVWMESTEKFDEFDIFGYKKTMKSGAVVTRPAIVNFEDYNVKDGHYQIKQKVFDNLHKSQVGQQALATLDIGFNGPFGAVFNYTLTAPTVKPITWNEGNTSRLGEGPWSNPFYIPIYPNRTLRYNTIFMGMKSPPVAINPNLYLGNILPYINPNPVNYPYFLSQLGFAYNDVKRLWDESFNNSDSGPNLGVNYNGSTINIPITNGK